MNRYFRRRCPVDTKNLVSDRWFATTPSVLQQQRGQPSKDAAADVSNTTSPQQSSSTGGGAGEATSTLHVSAGSKMMYYRPRPTSQAKVIAANLGEGPFATQCAPSLQSFMCNHEQQLQLSKLSGGGGSNASGGSEDASSSSSSASAKKSLQQPPLPPGVQDSSNNYTVADYNGAAKRRTGRNLVSLLGVVHDIQSGYVGDEAVVQFVVTCNVLPPPVGIHEQTEVVAAVLGGAEGETPAASVEEDTGNAEGENSSSETSSVDAETKTPPPPSSSSAPPVASPLGLVKLGAATYPLKDGTGGASLLDAATAGGNNAPNPQNQQGQPTPTGITSNTGLSFVSSTEIMSRSRFSRVPYDKEQFTVRCFGNPFSSNCRQKIAEGYVVQVHGQLRMNVQSELNTTSSHSKKFNPYVMLRAECGSISVLNGSKKRALADSLQREIEKSLAEGAKASSVLKPGAGGAAAATAAPSSSSAASASAATSTTPASKASTAPPPPPKREDLGKGTASSSSTTNKSASPPPPSSSSSSSASSSPAAAAATTPRVKLQTINPSVLPPPPPPLK